MHLLMQIPGKGGQVDPRNSDREFLSELCLKEFMLEPVLESPVWSDSDLVSHDTF